MGDNAIGPNTQAMPSVRPAPTLQGAEGLRQRTTTATGIARMAGRTGTGYQASPKGARRRSQRHIHTDWPTAQSIEGEHMPYKSMQQSRFMHAKHPGIAKRWDKETSPGQWKDMPKKVGIKAMAQGTVGQGIYPTQPGPTKAPTMQTPQRPAPTMAAPPRQAYTAAPAPAQGVQMPSLQIPTVRPPTDNPTRPSVPSVSSSRAQAPQSGLAQRPAQALPQRPQPMRRPAPGEFRKPKWQVPLR